MCTLQTDRRESPNNDFSVGWYCLLLVVREMSFSYISDIIISKVPFFSFVIIVIDVHGHNYKWKIKIAKEERKN